MSVLLDLRPRRAEAVEVYGYLFFLKALNSLQGAVLLLSRGMPIESEILSRTGLECAFELGAIAQQPGRVDRLEAAHKLHHETRARSLKDSVGDDIADAFGPEIARSIEEAAAQPKEKDTHKLLHAAEMAGMRPIYDVFYRGASGSAAHATVGAAMRHTKVEDGVLKIHLGPDYAQYPHAFSSAAVFLPLCFRSLAKIFGKPELAEAEKDFDARWGKIIGPLEERMRSASQSM